MFDYPAKTRYVGRDLEGKFFGGQNGPNLLYL